MTIVPSDSERSATTKVVVATTVALSFISFWRAAAVVLSDLASSAFYAGGIAEHAIGKSAPWFVLGVMLFSFAVRSVYMESSSMFVRGGVYVVVRDSMGPFVARISVSSLIFDYILTGPISVVSAGQYLGRLINEISDLNHLGQHVSPNAFAAGFGVIVTIYFWWTNIKGIHESSGKALRIMQITTVMVVAFLIWCPITLLLQKGPVRLPPAPVPPNLQFSEDFETLAQVYREIAYPKLKNLRFTGNLVCIYAVVCTGIITLFAGMIIPDNVRKEYVDNLLGGLAMHLAGPALLKLLFHVFVVIVGVLILSGAVNTSIIGANGVMNRVAEDGVLIDWFRKPHRRVRRGVELLPEVDGRAGSAEPPPRPGIQSADESEDWREGDSGRSDSDHPDTRAGSDRQSVLETDRDDLRHLVHRGVLPDLHHFRAGQPEEAEREEGGVGGIQPGHAAGRIHRNGSRKAGMRSGFGAGLQPHEAPSKRPRKNQPETARPRRDDRKAGFHGGG